MELGKVFKWGLIVVAVLVAWRMFSGVLGGLGSSLGGSFYGGGQLGVPQWAPNYQGQGVYGPTSGYGYTNPFYDSPDNPQSGYGYGGRGGRPRRGGSSYGGN